MSDLVERLRAWAVEKRNQEPKIRGYDGATAGLCELAADRIEALEAECCRLREAITEAIKLLGMDRPINPSNILRAALEDQSHD